MDAVDGVDGVDAGPPSSPQAAAVSANPPTNAVATSLVMFMHQTRSARGNGLFHRWPMAGGYREVAPSAVSSSLRMRTSLTLPAVPSWGAHKDTLNSSSCQRT